MKRNHLCCIFSAVCLLLIFPTNTEAQDQGKEVIVPAGTLLRCTLNEPNFSSKTADVGTPVVCPLAGLMMFDRVALPRGAYLGGRLTADKDPGHFVGKGYLKLEFDRIGLPDEQVPVPSKIISATGYKVDKEGKIIGHGHATRDAVEWMMPPLWPLKVLTLPARGPRPTLKGEQQLTLRLMDDVAVPARPMPRWPYLGMSSSDESPYRNGGAPTRYVAPRPSAPAGSSPVNDLQVAPDDKPAPSPGASGSPTSARRNVLVLRSGRSYPASGLHVDGNRLSYTQTDGSVGTVSLDDVDWTKTFQSNAENGAELAVVNESARH
jgi:hypothetical protein